MAGPVTIACPGCGEHLTVPSKPIVENVQQQTVLVRMDYSGARAHFQECARRAQSPGTEMERRQQPDVPQVDLAGRIHRMLDMRAYIATGGSRACTMCGTKLGECLTETGKSRVGCCASCTGGDTHPAPKGTMACAEWATEHGAEH